MDAGVARAVREAEVSVSQIGEEVCGTGVDEGVDDERLSLLAAI